MKYGLIAERVGHSFSAEIHKLFGYEYELTAVNGCDIEAFMQKKDFSGINVTIPYKQQVIPYLDYIDPTAREIGAVNTVVNKNQRLYGYNTDVLGLISLIQKNNISLKNKKVLILGSGGTSKTALYVANQLGCACAYCVSRTEKQNCISYDSAIKSHSNAEVIINTTPVGMYPDIDGLPIDISLFPNLTAIVDVVYNPLRTRLVQEGIKRNVISVGGLYMLVAQAAYASRLFTEKKLSPDQIDKVYTQILKSKQNIVIIGMPGCGKTSAGRQLAKLTDKSFIDTDDYITEKYGSAPAEIISKQGEEYFRRIESEAVKSISAMQSAIISTGGGVVLNSANMDLLRQNGRVYFIDRPLDQIKPSPKRPLSSNRQLLKQRYTERYKLYCGYSDAVIKPLDGAFLNAQIILEEFNENSCN